MSQTKNGNLPPSTLQNRTVGSRPLSGATTFLFRPIPAQENSKETFEFDDAIRERAAWNAGKKVGTKRPFTQRLWLSALVHSAGSTLHRVNFVGHDPVQPKHELFGDSGDAFLMQLYDGKPGRAGDSKEHVQLAFFSPHLGKTMLKSPIVYLLNFFFTD